MNRIAYHSHGEFRVVGLYLMAVLLHGIFANIQMPVLEVIWDSVFYKNLAFGLHHFSTFDLNKHFPVPPLYPLILSLGFFAQGYLWVEFIHSWMNPLLYFAALYPLYHLSRTFLSPRNSAWACFLFVCYPASGYAQLTMSENLATPLTLWIAYLVFRLLNENRPTMKDGTWLGIALAALVLTRIFLIVYCIFVVVWLAYRSVKRNRDPAPILMAFSLAFTICISVWWGLGYFTRQGIPLVYAQFSEQPLASMWNLFATLFSAHWTGLWIEGGLVLPVLVISQWLVTWMRPSSTEPKIREWLSFLVLSYVTLVTTVSIYYILRVGIEPWSISLRYIFYVNIIAIPACVYIIQDSTSRSVYYKILFLCAFLVVTILFLVSLYIPAAWEKLTHSHEYFSNAISLDVLYQIQNEGSVETGLILIGISTLIGLLLVLYRKRALISMAVILLYLQLCSLDHLYKVRNDAVTHLMIPEIHAFCAELDQGKWPDIPLYCEEDVESLVPNLAYWINRPSAVFPTHGNPPSAPYLLLTPKEYEQEDRVFESGNLKGYLINKKHGPAMN